MKRDWRHFLGVAIKAARASGQIQMRGLGRRHTIRYKGEINIVTEVDQACEETIHRIISKEFPDHEFLMEESGKVAARKKGNDPERYRWVIDPLDGTTNYAHGYPLFCTAIGLEREGKAILGVVYNPNRNELFAAVRGCGATLNGKRIRVSQAARLKRALLCTGFAYNVKNLTNGNMRLFRDFILRSQAVRRDGVAAVDICHTACGRFDGFWERGLWPWDVTGATLILQEAGGKATLFDGSRFDPYAREIVASNGILHRAMLRVLAR